MGKTKLMLLPGRLRRVGKAVLLILVSLWTLLFQVLGMDVARAF